MCKSHFEGKTPLCPGAVGNVGRRGPASDGAKHLFDTKCGYLESLEKVMLSGVGFAKNAISVWVRNAGVDDPMSDSAVAHVGSSKTVAT